MNEAATDSRRRLQHPDGSAVRVLVVDDEASLRDLLSMALRYEGWEVRTAADGAEALRQLPLFHPDAVVLDVMLPDIDGLQILSRMRSGGDDAPVLFLTARDSVSDRIAGLTAGGDDYVTKPFSLEEVVARLRGLIRRSSLASAPNPVLQVADLSLNEESYEVWRGEQPLQLTATEFELLRYLMRNPRTVLSKDQILDRVWSYDYEGRSSVVELYISYLRRKLAAAGGPELIHTVRGVGYMLKAPG